MNAKTQQLEEAVERHLAALQRDWPPDVVLRLERRSPLDSLVAMFLPAFPNARPRDVEALALFCRLYAGSILIQDRLLDADGLFSEVGPATMRVMAMQHESYRALHGLFPADAQFWSRFRNYVIAHSRAFEAEREFRLGRPLCEFAEQMGISIAIGKHGLARTIIAALVELTGLENLLEPLCRSIESVSVALQMRDDLEDWRLDLKLKNPSVLLARLPLPPSGMPQDGDWEALFERLALRVYADGHATHVLTLARRALREAESQLADLPVAPWRELISVASARCESMLQTIDLTVRTARHRVRARAAALHAGAIEEVR